MKKVICINDSEFRKNSAPRPPQIQVGDTATVAKAYLDVFDNNDPVYEFAEYPNQMFSQRYFAEISDLDGTTLVNKEFEEKYCVTVNENVCV